MVETKDCDGEQEGNCSHETEQGCLGCVHHVNEDNLKVEAKTAYYAYLEGSE